MTNTIYESASTAAVERLRADLEQEHRFKTSLQGYEKSGVNAYLDKLTEDFAAAADEMEAECARLREENAGLYRRLAEQESELSEARARARSGEESGMRESVLEDLRAANQGLQNENRRRQVEITELKEKMNDLRARGQESADSLARLNDRLHDMLLQKLGECDGILGAWRDQFLGVVASMPTGEEEPLPPVGESPREESLSAAAGEPAEEPAE